MSEIVCILPGGYIQNGCVYNDVELKPIMGREEELIAEMEEEGVASITTALLANCIKRLGPLSPVSSDVVRGMIIGDRNYLMTKLCQTTFGDEIEATLICPECSKKMEIDFSLSQIEVKEKRQGSKIFTMELSSFVAFQDEEGVRHRNLEFRLPNGGDIEAIDGKSDEDEAVTELLLRCIMKVGNMKMDEKIAGSLGAPARKEIEEKMSELAPEVELDLDLECPECQHSFTVPFNIGSFFLKKFKINLQQLYTQVHFLAFNYHWSEKEIMEMTRKKRLMYVEILEGEIKRINES